eukprot:Filipodium_phascolosomae@DN2198_c0_g1_i3.p1
MSQEWVHGLLGCCENPCYCMFSGFFPCCSACNIAAKSGVGCCCIHGCTGGICLGPPIREMYDIDGSCCMDVIVGWLCYPCALTRLRDQIELPAGAPGQMEMQ